MGLVAADIKARAAEIGFDLCGIARADRHPKLARLAEWITQGRAGEMQYLADNKFTVIGVGELTKYVDPVKVRGLLGK